MKQLIVVALFAAILIIVAGEEHHKKCCSSCRASYPHGHHLKHSCLRGCRLFSMLYLAHDKSVLDTELASMCSKSCQHGYSGIMTGASETNACLTGCREQERVFKEHGLGDRGAKMSVLHDLGVTPEMHSPMPFHHRMFQQMREMHERMVKAMSGVKQAVIQHIQIRIHYLPPGPDGKPRYQVEIRQHRMPFVFGHPLGQKPPLPEQGNVSKKAQLPLLGGDEHDKMLHGPHHPPGHHEHGGDHPHKHGDRHHHHRPGMEGEHGGTVIYRVRHFFTDMSAPAKTALRWSLFGLLLASVLCLGWLCCRTCRRAAVAGGGSGHLEKPHLSSLTKAFIKKKPCVQSGDIFYVDVSSDKKPLIEDDSLQESKKEEA